MNNYIVRSYRDVIVVTKIATRRVGNMSKQYKEKEENFILAKVWEPCLYNLGYTYSYNMYKAIVQWCQMWDVNSLTELYRYSVERINLTHSKYSNLIRDNFIMVLMYLPIQIKIQKIFISSDKRHEYSSISKL